MVDYDPDNGGPTVNAIGNKGYTTPRHGEKLTRRQRRDRLALPGFPLLTAQSAEKGPSSVSREEPKSGGAEIGLVRGLDIG